MATGTLGWNGRRVLSRAVMDITCGQDFAIIQSRLVVVQTARAQIMILSHVTWYIVQLMVIGVAGRRGVNVPAPVATVLLLEQDFVTTRNLPTTDRTASVGVRASLNALTGNVQLTEVGRIGQNIVNAVAPVAMTTTDKEQEIVLIRLQHSVVTIVPETWMKCNYAITSTAKTASGVIGVNGDNAAPHVARLSTSDSGTALSPQPTMARAPVESTKVDCVHLIVQLMANGDHGKNGLTVHQPVKKEPDLVRDNA